MVQYSAVRVLLFAFPLLLACMSACLSVCLACRSIRLKLFRFSSLRLASRHCITLRLPQNKTDVYPLVRLLAKEILRLLLLTGPWEDVGRGHGVHAHATDGTSVAVLPALPCLIIHKRTLSERVCAACCVYSEAAWWRSSVLRRDVPRERVCTRRRWLEGLCLLWRKW